MRRKDESDSLSIVKGGNRSCLVIFVLNRITLCVAPSLHLILAVTIFGGAKLDPLRMLPNM